jgi:hypothetical protein
VFRVNHGAFRSRETLLLDAIRCFRFSDARILIGFGADTNFIGGERGWPLACYLCCYPWHMELQPSLPYQDSPHERLRTGEELLQDLLVRHAPLESPGGILNARSHAEHAGNEIALEILDEYFAGL